MLLPNLQELAENNPDLKVNQCRDQSQENGTTILPIQPPH